MYLCAIHNLHNLLATALSMFQNFTSRKFKSKLRANSLKGSDVISFIRDLDKFKTLKNNFAIIPIISKTAAYNTYNTLYELCVKINSYLSKKGCEIPQGRSSMINRLVNGFCFVALTRPWHNLRAFTSIFIFCKCDNRNSSILKTSRRILRRIRSSRFKAAAPVDMQLYTVACNIDCISASCWRFLLKLSRVQICGSFILASFYY